MSKVLSLLAITLIGGAGFVFLQGADNAAKTRLNEAAISTGSITSSSENKSRDQEAPRVAPKIVLVTSPQRLTLIRDIQQELKRVGCHAGDVGTAWDNDAKDSMQRFMQSVNATLPIAQPDHILLTLLQGFKAMACGAPCPESEQAIGNGHCMEYPVVAQAADDTPPLARTLDSVPIETIAVAAVAVAKADKSTSSIASNAEPAIARPHRAEQKTPRLPVAVSSEDDEEGPAPLRLVATVQPRREQHKFVAITQPTAKSRELRVTEPVKPLSSPQLAKSQLRQPLPGAPATPARIAQAFNTSALNARLTMTER